MGLTATNKSRALALTMFVGMCLISLTTLCAPNAVRDEVMTIYLLDYSVGFGSRMLVGSLISLFTDSVTSAVVWYVMLVSRLVAYALACAVASRTLDALEDGSRNFYFFVCAVFVIFPFSLATFFSSYFFTDIYWYITAAVTLLTAEKRISKWLIPLFCLLGIMNHTAFVLAFLPLFAAIILYRFVFGGFKKGELVLLGVTLTVSAAALIYFLFFSKSTVSLSADELLAYAERKLGRPLAWADARDYYEYHILGAHGKTSSDSFVGYVAVMLRDRFDKFSLSQFIPMFISFVAISAFFAALWSKARRLAEGRAQKLIFVLFALLPLCGVVASVLSTDTIRWFSASVLCEFCLLFLLLRDKNEPCRAAFSEFSALFSRNPLPFFSIFAFSLVFFMQF